MLVVGVVAGVIFFPSLILRGPYFTLVSIAFAESIRQFIINSEFFGRASGVGLPFGKDSFAQFRFTSKVPYYYIGFIMMVGVYLIMKKIGHSKLGFALRTIREDEDAAPPSASTPPSTRSLPLSFRLSLPVWSASSTSATSATSTPML